MRKLFCTLACLFLFVGVANAQYYDGYRQGGFTYRGTHWYDQYNNPHTLSYNTIPGYYQNGCYYASNTYPVYTRYYPPTVAAPVAAPITYQTPDWRGKLIDLGAQRDKYEAKIRTDMLEQAYFIESVRAMGLEGNFRWQNYGQIPNFAPNIQMPPGPGGYNYSGHLYSATIPISGNTTYGYTYNQLTQMYGDTNMNQLFTMAYQLAQGGQKLGSEATGQFGQLVAQAGQNQGKVAEHLAKAEVLKQVLSYLQNPGEIKGFSFKATPMGYVEKDGAGVAPKDKQSLRDAWGQMVAAKCANCHNSETKKGGFDVMDYLTMSQEQKQKRVFPRVFDTDANSKTRMPRLEDGSPGPQLTQDEMRLWLLN